MHLILDLGKQEREMGDSETGGGIDGLYLKHPLLCLSMWAALAMGVMEYGTVLKKMLLFTMSRAWQLGRAVQRAKVTHSNVIQSILEEREGMVLIIGKVRQ